MKFKIFELPDFYIINVEGTILVVSLDEKAGLSWLLQLQVNPVSLPGIVRYINILRG